MGKILVAGALAAFLSLTGRAVEWRGLGEASYYAGPKVTAQDLDGKVVLVDCWGVNCPPCRALLPRMEQLWKSLRTKPFVLLGSHRQGNQPAKVKELVEANKLTYPQYNGAGLASGEPAFRGIPFLYVVNARGRVVYSGRDERAATEAVMTALGELSGAYNLLGGVELRKYKPLAKQMVLGKSLKTIVKKLEGDIKKGQSKSATPVQKAQAEEAEEVLKALDEAKEGIKLDIENLKEKDAAKAIALIKSFAVSFPEDGADCKKDLPELAKKAKEQAKAAKEGAKKAK